ncbi:MAG: DUF4905 domain-containing protein [Ignavibacteriaceae bacterium]|nr:DUF4905 domain-containing protein [Ignavibacteriaceae bacterium]
MRIKKKYTNDNKRPIWRILPSDTGKLIIEEREKDDKQVYFNCLNIESGKKIFKNFQLEEKFWIGIEAVYKDVIYFHKYVKPDMPQHIGIIAMNLNEQKILWENFNSSFLFIWKEKVYCFQQMFEGRKYFSLDYESGELIEDFGEDAEKINEEKKELDGSNPFSDYLFPISYNSNINAPVNLKEIFQKLRNDHTFSGNIEFVQKNNLLLFNFHIVNSEGNLSNMIKALDLSSGKYIFEETLIKETKTFAPDSFFVKDDFLFLLFGKNRLSVYSIKD